MLALGIRYLNGWAMAAADGSKKEAAEWPPHPDRVYMALAAAHFETERRETTRAVLEWLECLPPPEIAASDCEVRTIATHYVPVNDATAPSIDPERAAGVSDAQFRAGLSLLPEHRSRQPRQFPVAIPFDDTVYLIWPSVKMPDELGAELEFLCANVTCIGHSASLVQMWVTDQAPAPTWQPSGQGMSTSNFRVPTPGRLAALEAAYNEAAQTAWFELDRSIAQATGQARKALKAERKGRFDDRPPMARRPPAGFWTGYAPPMQSRKEADLAGGVFSPRLLVFRQTAGTRLGLESTLHLTQSLRDCLLSHCPAQPPPEWLSGHAGDGTPSRDPHLAAFPLPHVGHANAQGHLLGLALALPVDVPAHEVGKCLAPLLDLDDQTGLPKPFRLYAGQKFEIELQLDLADDPARALRPDTWIGPEGGCRTWATVTPIVLDRHGRSKDPWLEAEDVVATACERAGLPRPEHLVLGPVSHFIGAPPAGGKRGAYPHLLRKDGGRRHHVHAVLTFQKPIQGPVLVGAGRFRGYGLCRPWPPHGGQGR